MKKLHLLCSALLLALACLPAMLFALDQPDSDALVVSALHPSPFPCVLVWMPRERRVVEQALAETIIHQALGRDDLYYKIVDNTDAFEGAARSGIFNVAVLFDAQETVLRPGLLKDLVRRGLGIAVVGPGTGSRIAAEQLGFTLEEPAPKKGPDRMVFADSRAMRLSGSVPISGKALFPKKKGSLAVAFYQKPDRPAAVLEQSAKGGFLVMPFSLTGSAYRAGVSAPYSLLLHAAVLAVVPQKAEPGGPAAEGISIVSPSGPLKARIRATPGPGSQVLWANAGGRIEQDSVSFDVLADRLPRNLYYLYIPKAGSQSPPTAEVFIERDGTYRSQGMVR